MTLALVVIGTALCWLIFFIFDGIPPRQEAVVYVPEPAVAPTPVRAPTVTVTRCPCGGGYWVKRSNAPSQHFTGPVPEGEALKPVK